MAKVKIARRLGRHRETIHLWIRGIEEQGLLLDRYQRAKKGASTETTGGSYGKTVGMGHQGARVCCGQKKLTF